MAEGRPLSTDEEEVIDGLSEVIHPVVTSHIAASGELNLPAAMPEVVALIIERSSDKDRPSDRVVYGAVLLAAATELEARVMRDYL